MFNQEQSESVLWQEKDWDLFIIGLAFFKAIDYMFTWPDATIGTEELPVTGTGYFGVN